VRRLSLSNIIKVDQIKQMEVKTFPLSEFVKSGPLPKASGETPPFKRLEYSSKKRLDSEKGSNNEEDKN
jgi:hypothetical protein